MNDNDPAVVPREEWLGARLALLEREKALSRERDALSAARRALPWVLVEKEYTFETHDGRRSLAGLFAGRSQLIVYHFMFGDGWLAGCKSCSFWADNFNGITEHLAARDVTMLAVSSAPLAALAGYRRRMGWHFDWVSSAGSEFNVDLGVSFKDVPGTYNYRTRQTTMAELPGVSVFARKGELVYHTYSTYSRGLDVLNTAYQLLDLVPKGRDEDGLEHTMAWLRRRDEY